MDYCVLQLVWLWFVFACVGNVVVCDFCLLCLAGCFGGELGSFVFIWRVTCCFTSVDLADYDLDILNVLLFSSLLYLCLDVWFAYCFVVFCAF